MIAQRGSKLVLFLLPNHIRDMLRIELSTHHFLYLFCYMSVCYQQDENVD